MLNELQILEKHLGKANEDMLALKHETQKFVSDISDANDFIAALQLINKGLKNMLALCEGKDFKDLQVKVSLANLCMEIVDSSYYMNISLFDNSYLVNVGPKDFHFKIDSPTKLLENDDYEGMIAYMQDKLEESKKLLSELGMAIMGFSPQDSFGLGNAKHDYSAAGIKNIFK